MKKWKLITGITLVFVLGVLAGAMGNELYHRHRIGRFMKDPAARRAVFLEKLTKELRLTPKQQESFRAIIEETDRQRKAFFQKKHTEIKMLVDKSFARMKEKLDPEQQKRLEELRAKHEKHRKKRPKRPPLP